MTTKNTRWKCPTCNGGLLAPTRPRLNDVRRYCLPCSAKAGVLVQRIAPALEKQREIKTQQRRAKAQTERAKSAARNAPMKAQAKATKQRNAIFNKEADKLWVLFQNAIPHRNIGSRPPLRIVFTRQNRGASGVWNGINATIRIGRGSEGGVRTWEVLAHELCHAAHRRSGQGGEKHGREFYTLLRTVTEARWKVVIDGWHHINGYTTSSRSWGYNVDDIIEGSLRRQKVVGLKFPAADSTHDEMNRP